MTGNDYIEWLYTLESCLKRNGIDFSEYDEFHINEAIYTTEKILRKCHVTPLHLTESMVDEYMNHAIKTNPDRKDYYETISCYVKKRLINR